jgi:integrase
MVERFTASQTIATSTFMALILKRTSKWWYALFKSKGRRKAVNLGIQVEGQRPKSLADRGDDLFELSRGRALGEHDRRQKEFEADRTGERLVQNLAEIKAGRKVTFPALKDLGRHWESIPRRKAPKERYATQCKVTLERFASFVAKHQPDALEFVGVKPETARAFMEAEETRGVSPKTWSDTLKLLRATFKHLHPHLNDGSNPFHGLVTKAAETVNREPFSVEELTAILQACADDDFIRPVIIAGMSTAMRRGDCCTLRWADVDRTAGFLSVKTAKTGETVDIPIFPLLATELKKAKDVAGASEYCFPKAAEMYRNNPDGITWRVKQVLAKALKEPRATKDPAALPEVSSETVRSRVVACLDGLEDKNRAQKLWRVFEAYHGGASLDEVIAKTGCSRGTVSNYLNQLEREAGVQILRGKRRALKTDGLQVERENGQRRASVHDFHSFRVTWITLALAAGVPLELVQRVTGHRTVAVVLKHYFRPGREDFRQVLLSAMPTLIASASVQSPKEEIAEILKRMTIHTLESDRIRLIELLARI